MNWDLLLNVPWEKWKQYGVTVWASSYNGDGIVNSFLASINGKKFYGYRKYKQGHPVFEDPYFEVVPA
jgi:hypothetical protein